eukprot:scaffold1664_cov351-Prasinococcus_capsulatus_cf.AAC.8
MCNAGPDHEDSRTSAYFVLGTDKQCISSCQFFQSFDGLPFEPLPSSRDRAVLALESGPVTVLYYGLPEAGNSIILAVLAKSVIPENREQVAEFDWEYRIDKEASWTLGEGLTPISNQRLACLPTRSPSCASRFDDP